MKRNKMIKSIFLSLSALFISAHAFSSDWGQTGHRVIGFVAQQHLSEAAAAAIDDLLDGESLAFASTYGDEIRSIKSYKKYDPWHYVNMPLDKRYAEVEPSEKGDVFQAIKHCLGVLQDTSTSREDKAFHLRLLVHFVGDIHQPLHVGRAEDRGGNGIKVLWFGKKSNIHRVWDSEMINGYQMSYTELAQNLPRHSEVEQEAIATTPLSQWVDESQDYAKQIYGDVEQDQRLGYAYQRIHFPTVRFRLYAAGLRLAHVLNETFATSKSKG
jgi:hypothetical protein